MRLTVLATIQKAAAELGLSQPTTVVASNDTTTIQMLALLGAVCDELVRDFEWSFLTTEYTFSTVDSQDTYPLPSDFLNVKNDTEWNRSNRRPLIGPVDPASWQQLKSAISASPQFAFRIKGSSVVLLPVPASSGTMVALEYISANYVVDGVTGLTKSSIDANTDTLLFDDRLVINALKLKFKEATGLNTDSAAYDFETTYKAVRSADAGAPKLMMGRNTPNFNFPNVPDGNWNS